MGPTHCSCSSANRTSLYPSTEGSMTPLPFVYIYFLTRRSPSWLEQGPNQSERKIECYSARMSFELEMRYYCTGSCLTNSESPTIIENQDNRVPISHSFANRRIYGLSSFFTWMLSPVPTRAKEPVTCVVLVVLLNSGIVGYREDGH
jgi:hypothetical protein